MDDEDSFDRLISQSSARIDELLNNDTNRANSPPLVYTNLTNVVIDHGFISGENSKENLTLNKKSKWQSPSDLVPASTVSGLGQENVWYGQRKILSDSDTESDDDEKYLNINSKISKDVRAKLIYEERNGDNIDTTLIITDEIFSEDHQELNTTVVLEKSPRKRNRRKQPETWKMNIRKTKRNCGQMYKNSLGRIQEAKCVKICDCTKCPFKCSDYISEEERLKIFTDFWDLIDYSRQTDYIAARVKQIPCKRQRADESRRKRSFSYAFHWYEKKLVVCKKFFLATLSISDKRVRVVMDKLLRSNYRVASPDGRGRHEPGIKISPASIELANNHIDQFPRVPAHYCRKDSAKVYLETILNKEIMYNLYLEHCKELGGKPISKSKYKDILLDRKIAFYIPKKDACWCVEFHKKVGEEREKREAQYDIHQKRKEYANEEKKRDAERTKNEDWFLSANFDLEAVLYCPLFFSKPLFYKRKYALFNFTVYDVQNKQGHCYSWEENEGKRGANEIATCLYKFLETVSCDIKEVSFFSDCCSGQNRNSIVAVAMMKVIQNHNTINCINLKFLEPGHTHMECDSIHATIENASRHVKIFVPNDWYNVIRLAKKKGLPYKLTILKHDNFIDFKRFKDNFASNLNTSTDGSVLNWKSVKWLRVEKEKPTILLYKNEMREEFHTLDIKYIQRKNRKGPTVLQTSSNLYDYPAYKKVLPISKKKFKDLMELCQTDVIEELYKPFYTKLTHDADDGAASTDSDEIPLSVMREKMRKRKRL